MAARYFLISETGDGGAYLVDVEQGTVQRIEADTLAAGAAVPDSDLLSGLTDLRLDRNFTITRGVSLAIAASSLAGASSHSRREGSDG